MVTRRASRLHATELESRDVPSAPGVLSYDAPAGNGPEEIVVALDSAGEFISIFSNGEPVANGSVDTITSIEITADVAGGDSLVVDYSAGFFDESVGYSDAGSGVAATVTNTADAITLDFATSEQPIKANIGSESTTVEFPGLEDGDPELDAGTVEVVGAVSVVIGTAGDDTFVDNTTVVEVLTLIGGPAGPGGDGNDTYFASPDSTVNITDSGGNDKLDLGSNDLAVKADVGTTDLGGTAGTNTRVTVGGGAGVVNSCGGPGPAADRGVESFVGTSGDDLIIDNSTYDGLALAGGALVPDGSGGYLPDGSDTYRIAPDSTVNITDSGGNDKLDLGSNDLAVKADVGTTNGTTTKVQEIDGSGNVIAGGGTVNFTFTGGTAAGTTGGVESFVGTSGDDLIIDNSTYDGLALSGGPVGPSGDGSDTYRIAPDSTVNITDSGGNDKLDLGSNDLAVKADVGTTTGRDTKVTELGGDGVVNFFGATGTTGGVETFVGTSGGDLIIDNSTYDGLTLNGGGGTNTFDLQPGSTINVIGDGTILMNRARWGITANLPAGVITDAVGNHVLITGQVQALSSTPYNDTLIGGTGNNRYIMIPGGNDTITDTGGNDVIDFSQSNWGVKFDLGRTNGSPQHVDSYGNKVSVSGSIETAIGSRFADNLSGSNGADILAGLGGNDVLLGQSGNDVLLGGTGDDDLNGGPGRDIIVGGAGKDVLKGTSDQDILIAGFTAYDTVPGPEQGQYVDQVNLTAFTTIRTEWVKTTPIAQRVTNIRGGVGGFKLTTTNGDATVNNNDGFVDKLTGSSGPNWFFVLLGTGGDTITGNTSGSFFN